MHGSERRMLLRISQRWRRKSAAFSSFNLVRMVNWFSKSDAHSNNLSIRTEEDSFTVTEGEGLSESGMLGRCESMRGPQRSIAVIVIVRLRRRFHDCSYLEVPNNSGMSKTRSCVGSSKVCESMEGPPDRCSYRYRQVRGVGFTSSQQTAECQKQELA
jgi:hypothetical protein